jgi:hypothetical protein
MYRLPDGSTTKNAVEYLSAWHELTSNIEHILGCTVVSYDPDIYIAVDNDTVRLPVWFCNYLLKILSHNT